MSKDDSADQRAKSNRERLASIEREAIMVEEATKALALRQNMARLRELRLAKEAEEVRTKISIGNQAKKLKPRGPGGPRSPRS